MGVRLGDIAGIYLVAIMSGTGRGRTGRMLSVDENLSAELLDRADRDQAAPQ